MAVSQPARVAAPARRRFANPRRLFTQLLTLLLALLASLLVGYLTTTRVFVAPAPTVTEYTSALAAPPATIRRIFE